MSKILKLINDERKTTVIKSLKASSNCDNSDNEPCGTGEDYAICVNAVDICIMDDSAACTGGSVDICQLIDASGCMEKHYDSCNTDVSFCSEAQKYDYDTL